MELLYRGPLDLAKRMRISIRILGLNLHTLLQYSGHYHCIFSVSRSAGLIGISTLLLQTGFGPQCTNRLATVPFLHWVLVRSGRVLNVWLLLLPPFALGSNRARSSLFDEVGGAWSVTCGRFQSTYGSIV